MIKRFHTIFFAGIAFLFFLGCSGSKIVIPSYSPPREYKKLSAIQSGGDMREGSYMAIAINPEVQGGVGKDKAGIDAVLINGIKEGLTETNFITIYPIYDTANVALNMEILSYSYEQSQNNINADLHVAFTITKGVSEYISKTYGAKANRYSSNPALLPSKNQIIVDLGKEVTKKFISDITPLKTRQIREFKSMPSELEYIITYAKRGNFESAVHDMQTYSGEKDASFYYNLAVLYEGLGAQTGSMKALKQAKYAYEQSMKTGGSGDEVIINAKARFDNFYRLFEMTYKQKESNKALSEELDDMFGQTQ